VVTDRDGGKGIRCITLILWSGIAYLFASGEPSLPARLKCGRGMQAAHRIARARRCAGASADKSDRYIRQFLIALASKIVTAILGDLSFNCLGEADTRLAATEFDRWLLAMTARHSFTLSPRIARESCMYPSPPKDRGRGECRVLGAPADGVTGGGASKPR
jgi:hypothetical protein